MARETYPDAGDEFFRILHRGWRLKCCYCALIHRIDARVASDGRIELRIIRDHRATSAARRKL